MRKLISKILFVLLLLAGLGIMFYPQISNYVNRLHSSQAIQSFTDQIKDSSEEELKAQLALAVAYNNSLIASGNCDTDYYEILDFSNGIMGYVSIPCINVHLPIYHGVSSEVLSKGVGHMSTTAFPIGGTGNHSVLTGHTGLPSAELFTDLVKLTIGDTFYITIATEELSYEVDQIKIVTPTDGSDLAAVAGEDYCTLLTCTPYGINSHRLLVRGRRIEIVDIDTPVTITSEATKISPLLVIPFIAVPIFILFLFIQLPFRRKD